MRLEIKNQKPLVHPKKNAWNIPGIFY